MTTDNLKGKRISAPASSALEELLATYHVHNADHRKIRAEIESMLEDIEMTETTRISHDMATLRLKLKAIDKHRDDVHRMIVTLVAALAPHRVVELL